MNGISGTKYVGFGTWLVVLMACGDATGPENHTPARIDVIAGDGQEGRVGQQLPSPIVVRVVDQAGEGVSGVPLKFTVISGNGFVQADSVSDTSGQAVALWRLGSSTSERHELSVSLRDPTKPDVVTPVVVHAIALADSPTTIQRVAGPEFGAPGSVLDALRIRILDRYGNGVPGQVVHWRVTRGGGSIYPQNAITDESGASSATWILGPTAGFQAVEAVVENSDLHTEFVLLAGLARIEVTPDSLSLEVGDSILLQARALDDLGKEIEDVVVHWASDNPNVASVDSLGQVLARSPGKAIISATAGNEIGTATVVVQSKPLRFRDVAVGSLSTCAVSESGQVYCWGAIVNKTTGKETSTPTNVGGSLLFKSITLSEDTYEHVCGITKEPPARAYCWGYGYYGQLGNGTTRSLSEPGLVVGDIEFVQIDAGYYVSCAIAVGGKGFCWGYNNFYAIGNGSPYANSFPTPEPLVGNIRFSSISIGELLACGISVDRELYCWGSVANEYTGSQDRNVPKPVRMLLSHESPTVLAVGEAKLCVITDTGAAYCGPSRLSGIDPIRTWPTLITGIPPLKDISTNGYTTCGLTTDGVAYCWGHNEYGQLGDGSTQSKSWPVRVATDVRFSSIAAGWHTCAVSVDGEVYCWGRNTYGQIGAAATKNCRWATTMPDRPCNVLPTRVLIEE